MRAAFSHLVLFTAALAANVAGAYPDGAPWGAANPSTVEHCASCHYDYDAVQDSDAITIDGLPDNPVPDTVYDLIVRFSAPDAATSGFQIVAQAEDHDAGVFSGDTPGIEFIGAAIRSTKPAEYFDGVSWVIRWRAPSSIMLPIVFFVAASASNDDGSPLGDTIHYRSFKMPAE